ncbi:hypothetical protein BS47DRAFT_1378982 [Hydnum rufescens UP504]|uniref:GrpE protein homolog, mitochondrial n=1 Tax=Hydnum rufescens UP504 TaxID=1448309 RepID=A0A9P6DYY2_9AGAM|nr:hypothetical protein BS47DRAFT_1378982 [Hydnum rufescens UP504]
MNAIRILRRSAWTARIPRSAPPLQYCAHDPRTLSFRLYSTEQKPVEATPESSAPVQDTESPSLSKEEALIVKKDTEILELQVQSTAIPNRRLPKSPADSGARKASKRKISPSQNSPVIYSRLWTSWTRSEIGSLRQLYQGVEITERQLLQTLAKHGVKPYDPLGEKFDPNRHDAMYSVPAPEGREPGQVIDVQKLGYTIKDRTLRAPQVGVAAEKTAS